MVVGGTSATRWPYAPPTKHRRLTRGAPAALIVAVLGLQSWAMAGYHDDWPFAANAMFAFPRDASEPTYELRTHVEVDGQWRPLDPVADLGINDPEHFRRMFFSVYYGSTDEDFPQRAFSSDNRARFEARLSTFCRAVARSLADRGESATAMRLELRELRREDGTWVATHREAVGACDPIDSAFRSAGR
jgi:hypothetical protein